MSRIEAWLAANGHAPEPPNLADNEGKMNEKVRKLLTAAMLWDDARGGPMFRHDCKHCIYLGTVQYEGNHFDLYVHPGEKPMDVYETVIGRWSSHGPDYKSGISFGQTAIERGEERHPLAVALRRGVALGVLPADWL